MTLIRNCVNDTLEEFRLPMFTDEELVSNLRLGMDGAFAELYGRYKQQLYTFCLRLSSNRMLAEDATHDAFMSMRENIHTVHDASLFRSWLFAIARNKVYKLLKRDKRNGVINGDSLWEEQTSSSDLETKELTDILSACINALKTEYREVILLREYENLSYSQIAAITGDSESSVKSRLFKARKALAEKLKPYYR